MNNVICNIFVIFLTLNVSAQVGMITDIEVEQRDDDSGIVDVSFQLIGVPNITYHIIADVSFDGGNTFQRILPEFISGSVAHVYPTNHAIQIHWDGLASFPGIFNENTRLRIGAQLATVNDIDGNQYKTIVVGNQVWMAENLKVTRYNNGDTIPKATSSNVGWSDVLYGVYTIYPFSLIDGLASEEDVKNAYGILYNGYTVIDEREVCPAGWHVPSDDDWDVFISYLMDNYGWSNSHFINGLGNKLKSCRQVGSPVSTECAVTDHPRWNSPHTHIGTDDIGFSALPAGFRRVISFYGGIGANAYFWSSTIDFSSSRLRYRAININSDVVTQGNGWNNSGHSIRCIRNID
jgi:uncharacterized protein (TIGR02145 family)